MKMSGGGEVARYYLAATYNQDNGVLKNNKGNNFDNNIKLRSYQVRSNVNVQLTPTTEGIVSTSGTFDDYTGPIGGFDEDGNSIKGGSLVFAQALYSNPVLFPATFPDESVTGASHPLFEIGRAHVRNPV